MAFAAVAGGVGAELTGGNFWRGAATGATVAGLNHLGNRLLSGFGEDEPKRKGGKGNTFRGGKQNQRDQDMQKYPKEFKDWYHKNAKDYKLPGQPDPNLGEPYQDWLDLGRPRAITTPTFNWNSIRERVSIATGLTGTALTIYLIISEGSRLFPPRNLIPIP